MEETLLPAISGAALKLTVWLPRSLSSLALPEMSTLILSSCGPKEILTVPTRQPFTCRFVASLSLQRLKNGGNSVSDTERMCLYRPSPSAVAVSRRRIEARESPIPAPLASPVASQVDSSHG